MLIRTVTTAAERELAFGIRSCRFSRSDGRLSFTGRRHVAGRLWQASHFLVNLGQEFVSTKLIAFKTAQASRCVLGLSFRLTTCGSRLCGLGGERLQFAVGR